MQAVDDLEHLTAELYSKYETQVRPVLEAINLPAYFGGITLKDKKLDAQVLCNLVRSVVPETEERYVEQIGWLTMGR